MSKSPHAPASVPEPTLKIALISRKGGVGKTTTAVNLGAALAAAGKKVLLLDLDGQAAASLSLGVQRAQLAPSLVDVLNGEVGLGEAVRPTGVEGLSLVTGSCDLPSLGMELAATPRGQQCLRRPLETVEGDFDVVLMDCPATLSPLPTAALVAADAYLVALTPQFLVLDGLDNFLASIERLRFRCGSKARLLGLLLSLVDYRTRTTKSYVEQLRGDLGNRVLDTELRVNVRLAEAPSFAQTIFEYAPKSSAARDYESLAEEILERWQRGTESKDRESKDFHSAAPATVPAGEPASSDDSPETNPWAPEPVPRRSEV